MKFPARLVAAALPLCFCLSGAAAQPAPAPAPALAPRAAPAPAPRAAPAPAPRAAVDVPPPLPVFDKSDPVKYGEALLRYSERYDAGWVDSYARTTVTQRDAGGGVAFSRKTRQMILEGKDGDKSMLRFLSPADISGVAVLNYAHPRGTDDSWLYLPASRRVRRISGANRTASFQGTEFSFEDLSRIFPDQFDWKFLGDKTIEIDGAELPVFELEARPRYKATGYSRLVLLMNRESWRVERTIFHDRGGRLLKTLTYSKWKHFHGRRWRATRIEMQNHQTSGSTTIELEPLLLNMALYQKEDGTRRDSLAEEQFTKRALERF